MSGTTVTHGAAEHGFSLANALGVSPLWVATTILVIVYAVLITEKINRAILAMLGAGLMVLLGVINQQQAVNGVDFNTITLLIGMMMIVSITSKSGLFQYVAIKSAKVVKAEPVGIMIVLTVITAVFSALLDNVTTVLLIAPITLLITDALKIKVFPFFFLEILASNIGGTATLIGDPPNIIIGSAAGLSFNDFVKNLAPVSIVCMFLLIAIALIFFRKSVQTTEEAKAKVMQFDEKASITAPTLMKKALFVLGLVLLGFTAGHGMGIEPGTSAMAGAALLLLLAYGTQNAETQSESLHHIFSEVEWVTIFFFVGLFIIVAGVEHTGLLELAAKELLAFTEGDMEKTAIFVLWGAAVFSALLDNIPFVATMIPLIESTADSFGGHDAIRPLWWSLALGACLGGNGSLIGASANLTVAAYAEKAKQPIKFFKFMMMAFPIMLLTVLVAHFYVVWRYF